MYLLEQLRSMMIVGCCTCLASNFGKKYEKDIRCPMIHDATSESDLMACVKMDKPLLVYIF